MNMGSTSSGTDWCIKALHPSDPITEVRGIPDQSAAPSMFVNYQTVATISPAVNAVGTWAVDMQLIPHPIAFAAYTRTDSIGTVTSEILNSQLTGGDHVNKFDNFRNTFQRWRLAYAAVTIYQDGPDLANQGTVVAAQKPVEVVNIQPSVGNLNGLYTAPFGCCPSFDLTATQLPDYNSSQAMPNAYFGRSREGVYVPLKLTNTHQQWHGMHDLQYQATGNSLVTNPGLHTYLQSNLPFSGNPISVGQYPFTTLNTLHYYQVDGSNGSLAGAPTSAFCNGNWADISFKNLAVTTSLSLFFRFGFECQTLPGSPYSPQLKLSPPYDPQAIATYFAISRELKDGFPADFNDLGKIWQSIKEVASNLAPVVEVLPYGSQIVAAGKLAGKFGDKLVGALTRTSAPTLGNTASLADKETARAVVKAATAPVVAQPVATMPKALLQEIQSPRIRLKPVRPTIRPNMQQLLLNEIRTFNRSALRSQPARPRLRIIRGSAR